MLSFIRIKRKVGDEPCAALVAAKRLRTDDSDDAAAAAVQNTVLRFVGTMEARDGVLPAAALSSISTVKKTGSQRRDTYRVASALLDAKEARRRRLMEEQKVRRYRIVSRRRGDGSDRPVSVAHSASCPGAGIVDVEEDPKPLPTPAADAAAPQLTCNGQVLERVPAADADYVYDLYTAGSALPAELTDGLLEMRPCADHLLVDYRTPHDSDSDTPFADDGDDSNAEDNWRNDYPDELEDSDYDRYVDAEDSAECDLVRQLDASALADDDEPLAYGLGVGGDDGDDSDAYQRYKARVLREMGGDESGDDDELGYLADDGDDEQGD